MIFYHQLQKKKKKTQSLDDSLKQCTTILAKLPRIYIEIQYFFRVICSEWKNYQLLFRMWHTKSFKNLRMVAKWIHFGTIECSNFFHANTFNLSTWVDTFRHDRMERFHAQFYCFTENSLKELCDHDQTQNTYTNQKLPENIVWDNSRRQKKS